MGYSTLGGAPLVAELDVVGQLETWYEIDLSDWLLEHVLKGTKEVSLRINNLADHWGGAVFITSKEGDVNNQPQLVVVQ